VEYSASGGHAGFHYSGNGYIAGTKRLALQGLIVVEESSSGGNAGSNHRGIKFVGW
jgi:hypothetical protein